MRRIILLFATAILGIVGSPMSSRVDAQSESKPKLDTHGDPLPPGASLRLGSIAFRHRFWMPRFAYAPDGKTIAATDGDHVTIWDIANEKVVRTMTVAPPVPDSTWLFSRVAYSPDGTLLVASVGTCPQEAKWTNDGRIFVFDAASGRFLRDFNRARILRLLLLRRHQDDRDRGSE